MNFNGQFLLSSAKKFLSDTAISFTILLVLLLTNFSKFADIKFPEGFALPISIVVIFLSYTFGLFISACSHFLFTPIIKNTIQQYIFCKGKRDKYTKAFFRKPLTYPFFKINNKKNEKDNEKDEEKKNFDTFKKVAEILETMSFMFRKIDKNIDYVEGLSQYLRNISFVLPVVCLILIILKSCEKEFNICYILFIVFTCCLLISLFLYLSARLYFYYNSCNIYMAYLMAKTSLSYSEDEDLYPTNGEAESEGELIAYRVIRHFVPNPPSNMLFQCKIN